MELTRPEAALELLRRSPVVRFGKRLDEQCDPPLPLGTPECAQVHTILK
jgi:hypothetical protein